MVSTNSLRVSEPRGEDVEESWQRHQADQRVVDGHVLQLRHGNNSVGVQGPVTQQDDGVTEVAHRSLHQRFDGLVQLEGEVGSAGDQTGDDDDVGVAVVDHTAQHAVSEGEGREEIQSGVYGVTTSAREELAGEERSDDDHEYQRESVEDEYDGVQWIDCFVSAVKLLLVVWVRIVEQGVPVREPGHSAGCQSELAPGLRYHEGRHGSQTDFQQR